MENMVTLLMGTLTLSAIGIILFMIARDQSTKKAVKKVKTRGCDDLMTSVLDNLNQSIAMAKKTPFHENARVQAILIADLGRLRRMMAVYTSMEDMPPKDRARQEIIDTANVINDALERYLNKPSSNKSADQLKEIEDAAELTRHIINSR